MSESDKEWLLEVLGASEKRLNARLDVFEQRFDVFEQRFDVFEQRFDVFEQRFDALEQRFDVFEQRFDALEQRFDALEARITRLEQELPAALERLETKLLTAFHIWASPMEMRVRSHTAVLNAIDLEIEAIKSKFNPIPPH